MADATSTSSGSPDPPDASLLAELRRAGRRSFLHRLAVGFLLPFRAARFLWRQRSLWGWVIVPMLLNLGIFAGLVYLLVGGAGDLVGWFWAFPDAAAWWGVFLRALWWMGVVFVVFFTVLAAYGFTLLLAGIIAGPFNDVLSDRTERLILGAEQTPTRDEHVVWGIFRAIGSGFAVLISYCVVMLPILMLNLIPFVGQLAATTFGTVVSALFLTLEFTDGPLDRRGMGLREKFAALEDDRAYAVGFGLGTAALLWIPLLNLLTIPVAVIGGTALGVVVAERDRKRSSRTIPAVDLKSESGTGNGERGTG